LARRFVSAALLVALAGCSPSHRKPGPTLPAPEARPTSDLVDIAVVVPDVVVDMRYATADNFLRRQIYPVARCLLRRPVAEALARAQVRLRRDGIGLKVWDCYRPFSVQQVLWSIVGDSRYVACAAERDGVPVEGSKHNRGAAVDVTLVDGNGVELPMPTGFDDFSYRAHRGDPSWSSGARRNAARLEAAMTAEGFTPLPTEWWHFDGPRWRDYPLADEPFVPGASVWSTTPRRDVPASAYRRATRIEIGCAGGITGGSWSLAVRRDGSIRYHERHPISVERSRRVSKATASEWFVRLERAKVLEIDTTGYARVTMHPDAILCDLRLVGPDHSDGVDVGAGSGAPSSVRDVYREIAEHVWGPDDPRARTMIPSPCPSPEP
jgi:beta-N-acetylhexosaminidase/D-alanyl-D-alanine dipeptidase